MKISKLGDISKNFEKKSLPIRKSVVNLHPDTNQLKSTIMNKQQMNGYYRQATKMANTLYDYMVETFENAPCVVYCVSIERWHNHVSVDVWVNIGNGFAPDEVREQVGCITSGYSFATYTKTKPEDYIDEIKNEANAFFIKAVEIQDKYNNNK